MPAKKKTEDEAAATKEVAVVETQLPADSWGDYGSDAHGFENAGREELAIPFINLVQSNSKIAEDDDHPAKAGDFHNNVMNIVFDGEKGLKVIPVCRQHKFVEWVPIDDGGGLIAVHEPDSDFVAQAKEAADDLNNIKVADGKHDLVETFYVYALIINPEDPEDFDRAVISFSGTKLKMYRHFFTKAKSQTIRTPAGRRQLPMWAHRYLMTSFKDENKKGQKYRNLMLEFDAVNAKAARLDSGDVLVEEAENFYHMIEEGSAKADLESESKARQAAANGGGKDHAGGDTGNAGKDGDEQIPF